MTAPLDLDGLEKQLNMKIDDWIEACKEIDSLREKLKTAEEALDGILRNVSLDWYVQNFAKDETPVGASSGIVATIHNRELVGRIKIAFQRAREARAWAIEELLK